ncbi:hypothetical protein [Massilia horti]|uniref:LTXXQ motif family protein n=1 Tax=Massilia horti TaxID=2562153 RepID=A0A4Y9SSX5_9BURK|nr:hypothetical protein [Massilia horti]TFW29892.1 hypothetical protein E4O92_17920 [Massilia horti]
MKTPTFARAVLLALALGAAAPTFATPLLEMHPEDLLVVAQELKTSLNLNANQQTLWQQVESRSRSILRERANRREKLQQQGKSMLDNPNLELRDLGAAVDAEEAASAAENKQLRELWLTVNDALDDTQRRKVAAMVADQMVRVQAEGGPRGSFDARGEGRGRGGMGHGRAGMGRPGGGMGGG